MKSNRLISLDIFRGLTIVFMIIVSTPGSKDFIYPLLRQSVWDGSAPADLVFPSFLFIVGVSMWFSLKKYGHEPGWSSVFKILSRTIIIFGIGLILNIFPYFGRDYSTLRIMGVLQRIALAYFFAAFISILIRKERLWIIIAGLLLLYWGVMALFGGPEPFSLQANFALKFDKIILGEKHMYNGYGIPFDPEGLFSTIPAIGTMLTGFLIGDLVGSNPASWKNFLKLLLFGAAGIGLGLLWNLFFPINEPLWTSSFVLFTSGIAIFILSVFYLFSDVFKLEKPFYPFTVFGMNSLFIYFIAVIWIKAIGILKIPIGGNPLSLYDFFYKKVCVPIAGDLNGSLMFAIIQMLLMWLIAFVLFRKKIFIKV
jgi:predicted acyltransferase